MNKIIDLYPLPNKSWNIVKLKDIVVSISNGMTYDSKSNEGYPITRIETIADGTINPNKVGLTPYDSSMEKYKLRKGDILYSHINSVAHIGKSAFCDSHYELLHGMNLLRIIPTDKINSKFLYYCLNSSIGRRQAYSCAKRAVNQASLSTSEIKKFEFLIPTLFEQKSIAHILGLMDAAINKNSQLTAKKELRKKWLMQNLLSGKDRIKSVIKNKQRHKTKLGDLPIDWSLMSLNNILNPIGKLLSPEKDKLYQQIGIRSHTKGIFHKEKVTGATLGNKRVFWVEPDCFVVNIVFAWEHAIAKTTDQEIGMIASHRFPMYRPKDGILDLNYLLFYFKSPRGKHLLGLASPGGAGRNKTLGKSGFMKLEIPVPPLDEQKAIAQILTLADKEIQLLKAKTAKLQEQKKGMMQVLLTGKKRLKINN